MNLTTKLLAYTSDEPMLLYWINYVILIVSYFFFYNTMPYNLLPCISQRKRMFYKLIHLLFAVISE